METIEHNGMTFVKATAIARKYRYTTDYIGQLCRSGKVEAKLIGRAWFVNEASLTHHKSDRYNTPRSNEIIINKAVLSQTESSIGAPRREIRPVLSKNTHRAFAHTTAFKPVDRPKTVTHVAVRYNPDSSHLQPHPKRSPAYAASLQTPKIEVKTQIKPVIKPEITVEPPVPVPVVLGEKAVHKLPFESLPEVPLRGDLAIHSLDDPRLYAPVEPVSSVSITNEGAPESAEISQPQKPARMVVAQKPSSRIKSQATHLMPSSQRLQQGNEVHIATFTPSSVRLASSPIQLGTSSRPVVAVSVVFVPVVALVSLALVISLFGLSSHAKSDGLQFEESLHFSVAAVVESVTFLFQSY